MPTYAYRCESCGHQEDVRQKITEPHLTRCPNCAQDTFQRQLTASNFQLKGSGWYVTDFRNSNKSNSDTKKSESSTSAQTSNTNESSASESSNADTNANQPTTTTASTNNAKGSSANKSTPVATGS